MYKISTPEHQKAQLNKELSKGHNSLASDTSHIVSGLKRPKLKDRLWTEQDLLKDFSNNQGYSPINLGGKLVQAGVGIIKHLVNGPEGVAADGVQKAVSLFDQAKKMVEKEVIKGIQSKIINVVLSHDSNPSVTSKADRKLIGALGKFIITSVPLLSAGILSVTPAIPLLFSVIIWIGSKEDEKKLAADKELAHKLDEVFENIRRKKTAKLVKQQSLEVSRFLTSNMAADADGAVTLAWYTLPADPTGVVYSLTKDDAVAMRAQLDLESELLPSEAAEVCLRFGIRTSPTNTLALETHDGTTTVQLDKKVVATFVRGDLWGEVGLQSDSDGHAGLIPKSY